MQDPHLRVVKATSLIMHSPLLSIHFYHAQSSFLPSSTDIPFIQRSFHTILPSCSWPFSQPHTYHIKSYSFLHQPLFLHYLYVFKPPQHILLCSISQLSHNSSSPSYLLISHLVYTRYSTHIPYTLHLHYI